MRTKLSARCLRAAAAALLVLLPACLARSVPVSSASLVSTPQQLKAAIEGGVEHIVIRKHLDLRELRAQNTQATEPFGSSQPAYFTRFASLRSIVVRCGSTQSRLCKLRLGKLMLFTCRVLRLCKVASQ